MTTISQILDEVSAKYNTWKTGIDTAEKRFCYLTKPSFQELRKFIMNNGQLNSDVTINSLHELLNKYKIVFAYMSVIRSSELNISFCISECAHLSTIKYMINVKFEVR